MYIAVLGGLLFSNCFYKEKNKNSDRLYKVLITVLWAFLAFRWGQGTDFFGYCYIFNKISTLSDALYNPLNLHSEIGFRFLCWAFHSNYSFLLFCIATFEMMMLDLFIKKHCENKILSLLLFYPTIYLTYFFSALREGIVIAFIMGVSLDLLLKGKYVKFVISILFVSLFHIVAVVFLLAPFFMRINARKKAICIIIACFIFLVLQLSAVRSLLEQIPFWGNAIAEYTAVSSVSIVAATERTISVALINALRKHCYEENGEKKYDLLFNIYFGGFLLYIVLMGNPLSSSRVFVLFKCLELPLISYYANRSGKYREVFVSAFIMLAVLLTIKNISSYISQGKYYSQVNILNYPYVTIFNKDDIYMYRESVYYSVLD